jgi:hypothetical protein
VKRKSAIAILVLAAVVSVGLWVAYAPQHRLNKLAFVTVTVDGRPVRADVYIGQPTENQAEAIALVRVPGAGDYFLDFEEARYREASDHEFIRLGNNVWTLKSMRDGRFLALLPFEKLNEFRLHSSNGHTITIQF